MSDVELIGFFLLMLVVVGLIVWGMIKHGKREKAQKEFLANLGFAPCEEEKKQLAEKITQLENNSEYSYSVRKPMKVSVGGVQVYFYTKDRRRRGDLQVFEDFFLSISRKTDLPFQIFLKQGSLEEGIATKLMRSAVTTGWDSQSDDLTKVELPAHMKENNILGLMGPRGSSVDDLFDTSALALLERGGDHDVFNIRCRGNFCSIETPLTGHKVDYEKVWSFIQLLLRQGL